MIMYVVGSEKDPTVRQMEQLRIAEAVLEMAIDRTANDMAPIEAMRARLVGLRAELSWLEKRRTR